MRRALQASAETLDDEDLPQLEMAAELPATGHMQSVRTGGLRGPWRAVSRALHLPYAPRDVITAPASSQVIQVTDVLRFSKHDHTMCSI